MTVPQLLLVLEEQERRQIENMLDQSTAVTFGAAAVFDGKQTKEWKQKLRTLLDK